MLQNLWLIDQQILLWIQNNLRNDWLNVFMVIMTRLGDMGMIWLIIDVVLVLYPNTRKAGIFALIALVFTVFINDLILKNLIARSRPFDVIDGLVCLIDKPSSYSFPSGHAASSFAVAMILFLYLPKNEGFIALVLAFLIAFSRMYIGVHYGSDVFGGALLGSMIAFVIYYSELYFHKAL